MSVVREVFPALRPPYSISLATGFRCGQTVSQDHLKVCLECDGDVHAWRPWIPEMKLHSARIPPRATAQSTRLPNSSANYDNNQT